jgi:hypothetical protein
VLGCQSMTLTPFVPGRYNLQWHFGPISGQVACQNPSYPNVLYNHNPCGGKLQCHHRYILTTPHRACEKIAVKRTSATTHQSLVKSKMLNLCGHDYKGLQDILPFASSSRDRRCGRELGCCPTSRLWNAALPAHGEWEEWE